MFRLILTLLRSIRAAFRPRTELVLENLALRHQLLVLNRNASKPKLGNPDRLLWIFLRSVWIGWEKAVVVIQPATVVRWHRTGFRLF